MVVASLISLIYKNLIFFLLIAINDRMDPGHPDDYNQRGWMTTGKQGKQFNLQMVMSGFLTFIYAACHKYQLIR